MLLANGDRNHKHRQARRAKGKGLVGMKPRPLMDLWIMGLLHKLIVRGSRLHSAFGEKGLDRSVYPTGGVSGGNPVFCLGARRTWDGETNERR